MPEKPKFCWKRHLAKYALLAVAIFCVMAVSASNLKDGDEIWKSLLTAIAAHLTTEVRSLGKE